MKYTLRNDEIREYNETASPTFPKYTTQLMNLANGNAQGTRPRVVGQLSELFPDFINNTELITIECWESFYNEHHPNAIENATERICSQLNQLREAMAVIDEEMVKEWVEDLVINKTFNGLYVQKAILASLAARYDEDYRLASPEEEALGIDGYVGNTPYSIKPDSYRYDYHPETIEVRMIYYSKTKAGLRIQVEE